VLIPKALCLMPLLLVACSAPSLADTSVSLLSDQGLIDADVEVAAPVERGNNQLFVELRPHHGDGEATLLGVRATMAAHGHTAEAATVTRSGAGFVAKDVDLFMSGRWLLELELGLDDQRDSARLPVDVP
jgi:hypothetical protein